MACLLTSSMPLDCADGLSGIEYILMGNFSEVTAFTEATGSISAITSTGSFYQYDLTLYQNLYIQ